MKKILLIVRGIPSKKDPMWGNFELDQAKALANLGMKVVCISIDRRIRFYWRKIGITEAYVEGIKMYNFFFPLPYRLIPRFLRNYVVDIFFIKLLRHIMSKEGSFDIIHGHYLPNIRFAARAKEIYDIAAVGTEHWSELKKPKIKTSIKKDADYTYPRVDSLISVSPTMKKIIKDQFGVESRFLGCIVDDVFEYLPKKDDGLFRFVAVGSLFPIKGFDVAIKAFAKANFEKDVQFYIIGEGQERGRLQRLIVNFGLEGQVFLVGRKTRKEIMEYMRKSSCYILSSKSENFATACMEALTAGLPVVMTKCGGPEDFVDSSNSVLVTADDICEMAEGLRYIRKNIDNYDRKKISESIKNNYSAKSIAGQLSAIYDDLN